MRCRATATRIGQRRCLGPEGPIIPETILTKDPSAELKPGQRDQDTLPPYEALDDILNCLVELRIAACRRSSRAAMRPSS